MKELLETMYRGVEEELTAVVIYLLFKYEFINVGWKWGVFNGEYLSIFFEIFFFSTFPNLWLKGFESLQIDFFFSFMWRGFNNLVELDVVNSDFVKVVGNKFQSSKKWQSLIKLAT